MRSDLDSLMNGATQAYGVYSKARDKSKSHVKKALETAVYGALQVLQKVFDADGTFKSSIPEGDHPALIAKIKEFIDPLAHDVAEIYTNNEAQLTETDISNLASICKLVAQINLKFPTPPLSDALSRTDLATEYPNRYTQPELDAFFKEMLKTVPYPTRNPLCPHRDNKSLHGRGYEEFEKNRTESLSRTIKQLRAILDNTSVTTQQVSDLLSRHWEDLINFAPPPKSFALFLPTLNRLIL